MECLIRLTQYDLIGHRTQVIAEGEGDITDGVLTYWEDPARTVRHRITFSGNEIRIEREADVRSVTVLHPEGKGETVVYSPYGMMHFDNECTDCGHTKEYISVEYLVYQGEETVSHQRMTWELKEKYS